MAKLAEYAEIRSTAGIFRDWTTVAVEYNFDTNQMRSFRFQVAEPSAKTFILKPGDRVDVALAGELVIENGLITARQVGFDATRHGVQLDGGSRATPIHHVSVDVPGGGQFRGYGLEAIANRVLQPYGLKFRVENPPEGGKDPFPNVSVRHGESPFTFLSRLATQRGMYMRAEADGTIVAGTPSASSGVTFEEGRNILSANCLINMPYASDVIGRSQQPGSDSLFGKKASEISAKSTMANGLPGHVIKVLADMPLGQKELQTRTNMSAQQIEETALQATIVYQGWLRPDVGGLWNLGELINVKSPMLFPTEGGAQELKVWGVTYSQDANGGTTTAVQLRNKATFSRQSGDAKDAAPFWNQPSTDARPETPT